MSAPYDDLRSILEELRALVPSNPRFLALVDQVDLLGSAYMTVLKDAFPECVRLSVCESRVFMCLYANKGKVVSPEQLWNATYFDRPQEPHSDPLNVRMCSIRKKLVSAPVEIETIMGRGYRLVEKVVEKAA